MGPWLIATRFPTSAVQWPGSVLVVSWEHTSLSVHEPEDVYVALFTISWMLARAVINCVCPLPMMCLPACSSHRTKSGLPPQELLGFLKPNPTALVIRHEPAGMVWVTVVVGVPPVSEIAVFSGTWTTV